MPWSPFTSSRKALPDSVEAKSETMSSMQPSSRLKLMRVAPMSELTSLDSASDRSRSKGNLAASSCFWANGSRSSRALPRSCESRRLFFEVDIPSSPTSTGLPEASRLPTMTSTMSSEWSTTKLSALSRMVPDWPSPLWLADLGELLPPMVGNSSNRPSICSLSIPTSE